jgi:hypothetical protein
MHGSLDIYNLADVYLTSSLRFLPRLFQDGCTVMALLEAMYEGCLEEGLMIKIMHNGGQRTRSGSLFADPARTILKDLWEKVEKADPACVTEVSRLESYKSTRMHLV